MERFGAFLLPRLLRRTWLWWSALLQLVTWLPHLGFKSPSPRRVFGPFLVNLKGHQLCFVRFLFVCLPFWPLLVRAYFLIQKKVKGTGCGLREPLLEAQQRKLGTDRSGERARLYDMPMNEHKGVCVCVCVCVRVICLYVCTRGNTTVMVSLGLPAVRQTLAARLPPFNTPELPAEGKEGWRGKRRGHH